MSVPATLPVGATAPYTVTFVATSPPVQFSGVATFTNGSTTVTGTGTKFLSEAATGQLVRITGAADSAIATVASVQSDAALTLVANYTGSTATAVAESLAFDLRTVTTGSIRVQRGIDGTIAAWSATLSGQTATAITLVHTLVTNDVPNVDQLRATAALSVPGGTIYTSAASLLVSSLY